MKQNILKSILRFLARGMLQKHKPLIVGITGSVGKSSTKEAIALALSDQYKVRKTEGNLNNEFGIPLTIFGFSKGANSASSWLVIIIKMFFIRYGTIHYPEALVLEMGVDRPGDMKYLLSFVSLDIGVVTHVSDSHLEYFKTTQSIAKEKGEIINHFQKGKGIAIVNADNNFTLKMKEKTNADRVYTYGFSEGAVVRGTNPMLLEGEASAGNIPFYSLKVEYNGNTFPLRLPNIVAEHHIGAALAAVAVAISLKLNLVGVAKKLAFFAPLPGRLRILPGLKSSLLLDDTYNASPASTVAAIRVLGRLQGKRKVAILGDMLELGPKSVDLHRSLYDELKEAGVNVVVLVGMHMRALYTLCQENAQFTSYWEKDPNTVAQNFKSILQPGDTILIKGSQGMRMEIISKALLIDESLAKEYLCRQSDSWLSKSFVSPVE